MEFVFFKRNCSCVSRGDRLPVAYLGFPWQSAQELTREQQKYADLGILDSLHNFLKDQTSNYHKRSIEIHPQSRSLLLLTMSWDFTDPSNGWKVEIYNQPSKFTTVFKAVDNNESTHMFIDYTPVLAERSKHVLEIDTGKTECLGEKENIRYTVNNPYIPHKKGYRVSIYKKDKIQINSCYEFDSKEIFLRYENKLNNPDNLNLRYSPPNYVCLTVNNIMYSVTVGQESTVGLISSCNNQFENLKYNEQQ